MDCVRCYVALERAHALLHLLLVGVADGELFVSDPDRVAVEAFVAQEVDCHAPVDAQDAGRVQFINELGEGSAGDFLAVNSVDLGVEMGTHEVQDVRDVHTFPVAAHIDEDVVIHFLQR